MEIKHKDAQGAITHSVKAVSREGKKNIDVNWNISVVFILKDHNAL